MAHPRFDHCGCFPTGLDYPGIAGLLAQSPTPGLAIEFDADKPLVALPLAVIDTETTGRDPARGDRIIEIAIVHFDGNTITTHPPLLFDPGIPIPPESSAVHGITDADVKGKPKFEDVAKEIVALLTGRIPVAYNASFDREFLYAEMRRAGIVPGTDRSLPPALRTNVDWIDPLLWARAHQSTEKGFKLSEVAARLGVSLVQAHRATDDAEAAGKILLTLLGQQTMPYREVVRKQRELAHEWERTRSNWRR